MWKVMRMIALAARRDPSGGSELTRALIPNGQLRQLPVRVQLARRLPAQEEAMGKAEELRPSFPAPNHEPDSAAHLGFNPPVVKPWSHILDEPFVLFRDMFVPRVLEPGQRCICEAPCRFSCFPGLFDKFHARGAEEVDHGHVVRIRRDQICSSDRNLASKLRKEVTIDVRGDAEEVLSQPRTN